MTNRAVYGERHSGYRAPRVMTSDELRRLGQPTLTSITAAAALAKSKAETSTDHVVDPAEPTLQTIEVDIDRPATVVSPMTRPMGMYFLPEMPPEDDK